MDKVRVIAPMGATVRGPAKVRLTKEQHASRAHVLGKWRQSGVFEISGEALTFKLGEEFEIKNAKGRLNAGMFEDVDAAEKAKAKTEAKAAAEAEAKAAAEAKALADAEAEAKAQAEAAAKAAAQAQ